MRLLLLACVLVPVAELYLLIRVGQWLGAWPTIGLVLAGAAMGAWLLRRQGLATLARGRRKLDAGVLPASEMVEGLLLAAGGALLLAPGFLTDAMGLFCLLPVARRWLARRVLAGDPAWVARAGAASASPFGRRRGDSEAARHQGHTIEGEFSREKDRDRS